MELCVLLHREWWWIGLFADGNRACRLWEWEEHKGGACAST